jgi:hypothetical protein
LRNYLARLGWSHGDDEIFSTEQMIAWFDIADINKAPARLDLAKMADVNAHYVRQSSDAELMPRIRAFLPEAEGGPELLSRLAAVGWDSWKRVLAQGAREDAEGAGRRRRLPDRDAAPTPTTRPPRRSTPAGEPCSPSSCRSWTRPPSGRLRHWRGSSGPSARPRGPSSARWLSRYGLP